MSAAASRDWDAATYDRVSDPQVEWAAQVLDRLCLAGDETVLDAGCGSGRVTALLLERLPRGKVVAVDAAPSMVVQARQALGERARVFQAELTELALEEQVDSVFSNAVFHWVPDHDALFARLHAALRPGGRLVAQCGGEGNVRRFHDVARQVASKPPFDEHLGGWEGPWNFAGPEETGERLSQAGFEEVDCSLQPWLVNPPEPRAYIETVCLGHHLERLPEELRRAFSQQVTAACGDPEELDYVRLNIQARKPERPVR